MNSEVDTVGSSYFAMIKLVRISWEQKDSENLGTHPLAYLDLLLLRRKRRTALAAFPSHHECSVSETYQLDHGFL